MVMKKIKNPNYLGQDSSGLTMTKTPDSFQIYERSAAKVLSDIFLCHLDGFIECIDII